MLEIDGSEGGGQILRTALSLSAVLRTPVRVTNIRRPRPNPGLQAQHLTGVNALARISDARVEGAAKGSQTLLFEPGEARGGEHSFDIGTAGSISLVLQALLPPLLFAGEPSHITIKGGTHVPWSPDFHFLQNVFAPALSLFGARLSLRLLSYGFYPKGGGEVEAAIEPCGSLKAVHLIERGECDEVEGVSACSNLPEHVARRQREEVLRIFPGAKVEVLLAASPSPGSFVSLWCRCRNGFLGASALGKPGRRAEEVGGEAAGGMRSLLSSPACVDGHLADQLMVYAALAEGETALRVPGFTEHMRSNAMVIEAFTHKHFTFDDENKMMSVGGIGFQRR